MLLASLVPDLFVTYGQQTKGVGLHGTKQMFKIRLVLLVSETSEELPIDEEIPDKRQYG